MCDSIYGGHRHKPIRRGTSMPDPPIPPSCRTIQEGTKTDGMGVALLLGIFIGMALSVLFCAAGATCLH